MKTIPRRIRAVINNKGDVTKWQTNYFKSFREQMKSYAFELSVKISNIVVIMFNLKC